MSIILKPKIYQAMSIILKPKLYQAMSIILKPKLYQAMSVSFLHQGCFSFVLMTPMKGYVKVVILVTCQG